MAGLDIVILGLSITSSWGNGHATTYRALIRGLAGRGHRVLFLERDMPWYAAQRDLAEPPYCEVRLYDGLEQLEDEHTRAVAEADLVIVGSCVPDGSAVGDWVLATARGLCAYYDIDTPVTLAALERGDCEYLDAAQIGRYDLFLSFTGGPLLDRLEHTHGARLARALYCCVDAESYRPAAGGGEARYDLGYMGTYSDDRQPKLERLLLDPARTWPEGAFIVAGPLYPVGIDWPGNVVHIDHVGPGDHPDFYAGQRWTLNLTRADMAAVGWAPSVRLFEAAACGTPIISDPWPGLDSLFKPDAEILITDRDADVLAAVRGLSEGRRRRIGAAARERVLNAHTAEHRAQELERYFDEALRQQQRRSA
jgi:spore maturation protein CgeB